MGWGEGCGFSRVIGQPPLTGYRGVIILTYKPLESTTLSVGRSPDDAGLSRVDRDRSKSAKPDLRHGAGLAGWARSKRNMVLPPPECRIYTPAPLAHAMVQAIASTSHGRWLDPCMGPGVFISCLREKGVHKERIVGVDIDPKSGGEDRYATAIRGVDFFQWCAATPQRFDRIVANPPYVAIRKLHPELQQSVASFGSDGDGSFARRSNYWCAFLSACLRVLTDHGSLAFVPPAAWDYAQYASDIRRVVYEQFQTVEVHRSHEPLFAHVREGCVVLVAKGYRKNPTRAIRLAHSNAQALIAGLKQDLGKTTERPRTVRVADTSLTPFSDLYAVQIGCVTGDANYFLLRESDRSRLDLPLESVRPVISKARHLRTAYLTSREWNRLLEADERVYMCGAGYSLSQTLSFANGYAGLRSHYPASTPMDPNHKSLPAANVANITLGFNDCKNGTLCTN